MEKENTFMNSNLATANPAELPIKKPVFHHVNLKTIRMSAMIDWYGKVIGSRKQFQDPVMGFITNDEAVGRIALLTTPKLTDDPDRARHTGIHHSAFEYASVDDLLESWVRMRALGIEPHACLDHGFALSFYYVDPDGNSVELQADWWGDWAKSAKFMETSPDFAAGPVGKFVDPAKLVEARANGMSVEDLHKEAYYGSGFAPAAEPDFRIER